MAERKLLGSYFLTQAEVNNYTHKYGVWDDYYTEDENGELVYAGEVTINGKYNFYLDVYYEDVTRGYSSGVRAELRGEVVEHTVDSLIENFKDKIKPCLEITTSDKLLVYSEDGSKKYGSVSGTGYRDYRNAHNASFLILQSADVSDYIPHGPGVAHGLDGTRKVMVKIDVNTHVVFPTDFYGHYNGPFETADWVNLKDKTFIVELPPIERKTTIVTATNFNDEENPFFTYTIPENHKNSSLITVQAALSIDGVTDDIAYRNLSISDTSYTFELTEAERELLRTKSKSNDGSNLSIYYLTKTVCSNTDGETMTFYDSAERILTIYGSEPQLYPTVKDIKPETLALTGNENKIVRYESMAEFAINATASKHAEIAHQSVTCGTKTVYDLPYGVIDDTESATFLFNVTDTRGLQAQAVVAKDLVEYIKPTCNQETEIVLTGETGATINLKVSGNYFNNSFGIVDNTINLLVEYRATDNSFIDYFALSEPKLNGNTYEFNLEVTGLDYRKTYEFKSTVADKLNTVISATKTVKLLPIFDWSETDFNFNTPINMNNKTVLRHNAETNNTVLSASGGHIYIRPKGTDNTSGETIIYPDGSIKFGGAVNLNSFTIGGNELADYVIESGEASMGTNGTWYWHKWASGKAECWGCRNFGNMAVTTAWGNLYRSAILTQDLPEDVFITTPDVININIVNGNYGGWICKHENLAPSAVTTGSFIWVRPASATVSPTYIGFHVIGVWKQ